MPIPIRHLKPLGEKTAQTIRDAEDHGRLVGVFEVGGEALVELLAGTFGAHRAIEVEKVHRLERGLGDVSDDPPHPVLRHAEPILELAPDVHHCRRDFELNRLTVRVQPLEKQALNAVTGTQVAARPVRLKKFAGLENRAQATSVAPIAAALVNRLTFGTGVWSFIHVEMAVEFENPFLENLRIVAHRGLTDRLLQTPDIGEPVVQIFAVRQPEQQADESDKCFYLDGWPFVTSHHPAQTIVQGAFRVLNTSHRGEVITTCDARCLTPDGHGVRQ